MGSRINSTKEGVEAAWDFWLSEHPISIPEIIQAAIKEAFEKWLDENRDLVAAAISDKTVQLALIEREINKDDGLTGR